MPWEDPERLRLKKLSREEYCQRMLTSLILSNRYPNWNTPQVPSESGMRFLQALHSYAYGNLLDEPVQFIDEFYLPDIDRDGKYRAPDYAVLTPTTLWIIELKTEVESHRKDQLPGYAILAAHHYPNHIIEITYITPTMNRLKEIEGSRIPLVHVFWNEIIALITNAWADSGNLPEQKLVTVIQRELSRLHISQKEFNKEGEILRNALALAEKVQETGLKYSWHRHFSH